VATFEEQVEALTTITISSSSTYPTEAQLTQFLTDGAKEIINILPPDLKKKCVTISILNDSATSLDLDGGTGTASTTNIGKITDVTRKSSSSGYYIPCRMIPSKYGDLANDSTSIYYATVTDPVCWITSNSSDASTLFVLPTTTSSQTANVYHVSYPSPAYSHTSIPNFPDEAENLVVLYAATKSLLSAIGNVSIPPNVTNEDGNTTSLTDDLVELTNGQVGTDDDFENFDKWFIALSEMIEDDEDMELANAQIQKIQTYINTFNIQLQANMQQINKYMQLFQVLRADYITGIQMLTTGGLAQPQQARR
jgi:hypothetical protein